MALTDPSTPLEQRILQPRGFRSWRSCQDPLAANCLVGGSQPGDLVDLTEVSHQSWTMMNNGQYMSFLWCFAGKPNSFVNIVNLLADPVKISLWNLAFLVDRTSFWTIPVWSFLRRLYFRQQGSEEMDLRMNTTAFWQQKALIDTTFWTVGTVICQMN